MSWLSSPSHLRWLEGESDRLLAFSRASRHPAGGFAWLDSVGLPQLDRPVELWVTCRMMHVFALGHVMGRPGCGSLADHGVQALQGRFHDSQNSGWYPSVDDSGPVSRDKAAYEHAFVLLAASSAVAASRPGASLLFDEALDVLMNRFWDEDQGLVVDQWDESFSTPDAYRGANANMHTLEALLTAADVTQDRRLLDRALRIVSRIVHDFARSHKWRLPEHFDEEWNPLPDYNADAPAHPFRPFGATVGHWFEWARLSLHLRAALGEDKAPSWLLDDACSLFEAAVREGWAVDGSDGFVYTVDWEGRPVVRERMHWVAAEATATAAALWSVTGEQLYADWYQRWWDHIATAFMDRERGSWFHELGTDNRPSTVVWSGKPDSYHALQATLIPRLPLSPMTATAIRQGLLA